MIKLEKQEDHQEVVLQERKGHEIENNNLSFEDVALLSQKRERKVDSQNAFERSRSSQKRNTKRNNYRWMLIVASVCILLLVGGVCFKWFLESRSNAQNKIVAKPVPYFSELETYELSQAVLSPSDLESSKEVVIAFLNAKNARQASQFVLGNIDTFEEFYQPLTRGKTKFSYSHGYQYENGARSAVYSLERAGELAMEVHVFAHSTSDFRVDWRSLYLYEVGYTLGDSSLMTAPRRVKAYLTLNNFYTSYYSEENYQSLLAQDFSQNIQFPAYVKKETEASDALVSAFQNTKTKLGDRLMVRATLTLSKTKKGYEILELHDSNWVNLVSQ